MEGAGVGAVLGGGFAVVAGGDVAVVVGQQEGGEGEGYDEAYEAEEGAPHGEGEEDDGGVEAHGFAHDFGGEEEVLDALHHDVDGHGGEPYVPEVDAFARAAHEAEQCGGYEGYELEVGHHVEEAYEEAHDDGHGEADDEEAYAEEDPDAEGYEGLAAEVVVHGALDVVGDGEDCGAVLGGYHVLESAQEAFVVEHDEDYIEDYEEPVEYTEDDVVAAGYEAAEGAEDAAYVAAGEASGDAFEVDCFLNPLVYFGRYELHLCA